MLMPQINQSYSIHNLSPLRKPLVDGATKHYSSRSSYYSSAIIRKSMSTKKFNHTRAQSTSASNINPESGSVTSTGETTNVQVTIEIQPKVSSSLHNLMERVFDAKCYFSLKLVSNEKNMETVKEYAELQPGGPDPESHIYRCQFQVPKDFGEIGAVLVENECKPKMFVKSISLHTGVTFTCDSWVHSKYDNKEPRIFFTSKSYLPSKTPAGIRSKRAEDLKSIRGNDKEERKYYERIYDYDVYNDLGYPELGNEELDRPVLGGERLPYPRRCRTGRRLIDRPSGPAEAKIVQPYYVPIDEDFSEIKEAQFGAKTVYSLIHVVPSLESIWSDKDDGFSRFTDIHSLYDGVNVPIPHNGIPSIFPKLIRSVLQFETPKTIDRDSFSGLSDEEFGRQMLAGTNPCSIQLVTEWPLTSKLDHETFGPLESAITKEIVEEEIQGFMTFNKALEQKKLFILDYHDLLLPYVAKTRDLKGTTLYGSRTLMFLSPAGTLMPIAIELTRPKSPSKPDQWKHVYTPTNTDATNAWLWKLAKAHVLAHDSGFHQLVSHWLRTHCATEPYIIATHRHLSQMHPIYRLIIPYFRYTLQINALARQFLISADGTIESSFSTGKYSMQLCSDAYDQLWRFDHQALPADLISRGMAVKDQNERHGLKLTIQDYPFANDGLLLWDAIKEWVTSYVEHYYPPEDLVNSDAELEAWWVEIQTVGHEDKKEGWPQLKTQDDLIQIVSIMIWVASGHHAAVNFGQYDFAGYFPNRPTIARIKMPNEDTTDEEWESFIEQPEQTLLKCLPSKIQAVKVMLALNVLSTHSPKEKYIGEDIEEAWKVVPAIVTAFTKFQGRLKEIEGIIDRRNANPELRNRSGAGLVPYQLLKPYSESGVTGMGVPNSISI